VPLQNRVTPLSEIIATPGRGLVYGNRGCLHDERGVIRRHQATRRWIACQLDFRGRHRPRLMAPGRYTELFFLDDATALAAGHRPCAECRRPDYNRLTALWTELHPGQSGADAIDAQLAEERLVGRGAGRRLHEVRWRELPDGTVVFHEDVPSLVLGSRLLAWSPIGYDATSARPRRGRALVITPPSLVALLAAGWAPVVPFIHPSAAGAGRPRGAPSPS
jgi:hypothetical protein